MRRNGKFSGTGVCEKIMLKENSMNTLRLKLPQWQGGVNPRYVFGSDLLAVIAPENDRSETVEIKVDTDFNRPLEQLDGIDYGNQLWEQMQRTWNVIDERKPDKIIVYGGDCAVTQVPFDYLSGKYGDKLGIIWLDAHPDCADISNSTHLHEMVMGNLIGKCSASKLTTVKNPCSSDHVFLAGLIEEELREKDMVCKSENMMIASPEELELSSDRILAWIEAKKIENIAIHWDLDVLSENDYRSIYPAEPHTDINEFPAAVGRMTMRSVGRLINDIEQKAEVVGLSITEHLPWDAFNMRDMLAQLKIFND